MGDVILTGVVDELTTLDECRVSSVHILRELKLKGMNPKKFSNREMQIYPTKSPFVSEFWKDKYERDAVRYWDKFYKRNSDRFFKDRHYLDKEWGSYFETLESSAGSAGIVLEIGCGAGNTVFPLLAGYPHLFMYACDFSPRAIQIVKEHPDYSTSRAHAFVCDVTSEPLTNHIQSASVDISTLVFMLSAVSPERMSAVVQNVRSVLKPGGFLLFRDYCVGDLSEERFKKKDQQQISENFFVRGDGTRAFYFSEEFLRDLFTGEGFEVVSLDSVSKVVENRSRALLMDRRWIQGVFQLKSTSETSDELGISDIFSETPAVEETVIEFGAHRIQAKLISRAHQHTCKNTGLMLWESALAMSQLLVNHPALVKNRCVLELGSGCVGVCSLLSSISASSVVSTDADVRALELLQENLSSNSRSFPVERISCRRLKWGNSEDISGILEQFPGGFEVIIGTDVTYVSEALPDLFATAKALISRRTEELLDPILLLCHLARKVDEDEIIGCGEKSGFELKHKWVSSDEAPFRSEDDESLGGIDPVQKLAGFSSTFLMFAPIKLNS